MPNVQITVWLRRKTGLDSAIMFPGVIVVVDDLTNEIRSSWRLFGIHRTLFLEGE